MKKDNGNADQEEHIKSKNEVEQHDMKIKRVKLISYGNHGFLSGDSQNGDKTHSDQCMLRKCQRGERGVCWR